MGTPVKVDVYGVYKASDLIEWKNIPVDHFPIEEFENSGANTEGKQPSENKKISPMRGVYVWGISKPGCNDFVPLYTGESESNVLARIRQHFFNLHLGNRYKIFDCAFYNDLLTGSDLIPRAPKMSKLKDKSKSPYIPDQTLFSSYFANCIFTCESRFLRGKYKAELSKLSAMPGSASVNFPNILTVNQLVNAIISLDSKEITSQGFDLLLGVLGSGRSSTPIQSIIDQFFSPDRFAFIYFLLQDPAQKVDLAKLEANVKFSLNRGTLSDSNKYDNNFKVQVVEPKNFGASSLGKYFELDSTNSNEMALHPNAKLCVK